VALVETKAKEELTLAKEKKREEMALLARAFTTRETALKQEFSI